MRQVQIPCVGPELDLCAGVGRQWVAPGLEEGNELSKARTYSDRVALERPALDGWVLPGKTVGTVPVRTPITSPVFIEIIGAPLCPWLAVMSNSISSEDVGCPAITPRDNKGNSSTPINPSRNISSPNWGDCLLSVKGLTTKPGHDSLKDSGMSRKQTRSCFLSAFIRIRGIINLPEVREVFRANIRVPFSSVTLCPACQYTCPALTIMSSSTKNPVPAVILPSVVDITIWTIESEAFAKLFSCPGVDMVTKQTSNRRKSRFIQS